MSNSLLFKEGTTKLSKQDDPKQKVNTLLALFCIDVSIDQKINLTQSVVEHLLGNKVLLAEAEELCKYCLLKEDLIPSASQKQILRQLLKDINAILYQLPSGKTAIPRGSFFNQPKETLKIDLRLLYRIDNDTEYYCERDVDFSKKTFQAKKTADSLLKDIPFCKVCGIFTREDEERSKTKGNACQVCLIGRLNYTN